MTNETKTRGALFTAASDFLTANASITTSTETVTGLPTIASTSIAWPNQNFDPAGKVVWSSVHYLPGTPTVGAVGPGGRDVFTGFIQIDINVAPDSGESELISWNEKSRLYFHGGRVFTYSGHSLLVISSEIAQSRLVGNNFRSSFDVSFRSHLKRPILT